MTTKTITFLDNKKKKTTIKYEFKDWKFSFSGRREWSSGQIVDDIEPMDFYQKQLIRFWNKYHLNNLNAGTKIQLNYLERVKNWEIKLEKLDEKLKELKFDFKKTYDHEKYQLLVANYFNEILTINEEKAISLLNTYWLFNPNNKGFREKTDVLNSLLWDNEIGIMYWESWHTFWEKEFWEKLEAINEKILVTMNNIEEKYLRNKEQVTEDNINDLIENFWINKLAKKADLPTKKLLATLYFTETKIPEFVFEIEDEEIEKMDKDEIESYMEELNNSITIECKWYDFEYISINWEEFLIANENNINDMYEEYVENLVDDIGIQWLQNWYQRTVIDNEWNITVSMEWDFPADERGSILNSRNWEELEIKIDWKYFYWYKQ